MKTTFSSIGRAWLAVALALGLLAPAWAGVPGYMMYPSLDGNGHVVFSAEGDLWGAPVAGGLASRLTTGRGQEMLAKFSPDGQRLAFAASYDGPLNIYVMPASGGAPQRVTFDPSRQETVGWSKDGKRILFRSRNPPTRRSEGLFWVDADGGVPERLNIGEATLASLHDDGKTIAFNRWGNYHRTWKRYGGGTNANLWIGDLSENKFFQATEFHGEDVFPMWHGDRLYFSSDRDGRSNLWSINKEGQDLRQHTSHEEGDIRWPDIRGGEIVYHLLGDLWIYDIASGEPRKLEIELPSDRPHTLRRNINPMDYIESVGLSWNGERLAFATRGDIFASRPKRGWVASVSGGSEARVKDPAWSPDGKSIAAWSTATGEEELWLFPSNGRGDARQLTRDSAEWHFPPVWSPDGKRIAWGDSLQRVRAVEVETGEIAQIDQSEIWETSDYAWSPDSRYLTYALPLPSYHSAIFIYDFETGEKHQVTSDLFQSHSPVFDPKGEYLFFISNRSIAPMFDDFDFQTISIESSKPYFLILSAKGESFLTAPELYPDGWKKKKKDEDADDEEEEDEDNDDEEEDEEDDTEDEDSDDDSEDDHDDSDEDDSDEDSDNDSDEEDEEDDEEDGNEKDNEKSVKKVVIDFDGIEDRVYALRAERGNYNSLAVSEKRVFFLGSPSWKMQEDDDLFEEEEEDKSWIVSFRYRAEDFDDREAETWLENVKGFSLSGDGSKMLIEQGEDLYIVETKSEPSGDDWREDAEVNVERLSVRVDPAAEWGQILRDAYLFQRQFFYAPNMGGIDWDAAYERYKALLPRIATRQELNDLIGQLIAELGTSHTYVWGGGDLERERGEGVSVGCLGADFVWDEAAGAYKIAKIYRGYSWNGQTSPLLAPHARVKEGHYLHAIDGRSLDKNTPPSQFLVGTVNRVVELTVSEDGAEDAARDVAVEALGSDEFLRYIDWVEQNRRYVAEKSNGEFGYLHIPDMSSMGMIMFNRYYYPQLRKKALVIDARHNGGGFVSQLIIERLAREVVAYGTARNSRQDYTYPDKTFEGPMVVLTNEAAGSDGDIFPEVFQQMKLGKVIGTRTWGGVVGIRGDKQFVDSGMTTQPEFAWWDARRGWNLENEGVTPDIIVPMTPEDEIANRDPQLDRAIAELQQDLAENKYARPERPPFPNTLENWKRRAEPFMTKP
jgi:tricorn protease